MIRCHNIVQILQMYYPLLKDIFKYNMGLSCSETYVILK